MLLVILWPLMNLFFIVYRRVKDLYSDVNDDVLDHIVAEIQRNYPNAGYRIIHGHLRVYTGKDHHAVLKWRELQSHKYNCRVDCWRDWYLAQSKCYFPRNSGCLLWNGATVNSFIGIDEYAWTMDILNTMSYIVLWINWSC